MLWGLLLTRKCSSAPRQQNGHQGEPPSSRLRPAPASTLSAHRRKQAAPTGGCGNGHPPESPQTLPLHPRAYLQRSPMTPVGRAGPPPLTAAFESRARAQQSCEGLQREGGALTVLPSRASPASCGSLRCVQGTSFPAHRGRPVSQRSSSSCL